MSPLPDQPLLRLAAVATLFGIATVANASTSAAATTLVITEPCTLSTNAATVSARLRVTDASGAALERAAVEVRCGSTAINGITAGDGTVALNLRPGQYQISVRAPGFADNVQTADLSSATTFTIALSVGSATDTINVTADTGFVPFASNAGSKTNALLIEVPQSISIINQKEMEARNVITMNEALRYTPGVQADEFGVEPRFDWLKIRGFSAETFGVFRDGMRFNSLSGKLDPYELESVEVLKGPSSVLYGQAPPGGLINQVTKRPVAERHTELGMQLGAYTRRQFTGDTTGSFDKGQVWRYRLLGLIRNSDTQVNFTPDNRRLIAPSLTWHPSDRTNFTVLGDWQHDGTRWSQFLPANGTLYNTNPNGIIPVSTFLGEPGWEKFKRDQASLAYTGDHLFDNGWNLHSSYRFQYINSQGRTLYGGGFDGASTSDVLRYVYGNPEWNHINTTDNRALRRFTTTNWEHTVLFGYDYAHVDLLSKQISGTVGADINIFHPVYGVTPITNLAPYSSQDSLLQQHGIYGQDQIKFRRHLIFTLGGRQDFAINDLKDFLDPSKGSSQTDKRFTGRAGLTYLTDIGIAPYVAYSTSFLPNTGVDFFGKTFKPSDGKQIEGGVKFQPNTWTGFITASVFNLTQTNVQVSDPTNPLNTLQSGEVRSRGFEVEGVTSTWNGLLLHGGYTLTATDTTQDTNPANIDRWLPQTPRNQTSFLADYTVHRGKLNVLSGLGGNVGVRFVGTNAADSSNSFFIPNYTLLDAAVRFNFRGALIGVNATNLSDKRYVATCSSLSACYYGYARNVIGTIKYSF